MKLLRGRASYPKDRDLVRVVHAAAFRVTEKIENLDLESLELSPHTRRRLRDDRPELRSTIESCARIFAWALADDDRPFSDLTVIAFCDSLGFFSLLARECNVGTVVYHDADDALRTDAMTIARAIGNEADHYVFGDVEELEFAARKNSIACDVLVSRGVIGHIENLRPFFDAASGLSKGAMAFGFAVENLRCSAEGSSHARDPRASPISTCCDALGRAGFQLRLMRASPGGVLREIPRRLVDVLGRARLFGRGLTSGRAACPDGLHILCGSRSLPTGHLGTPNAALSPTARHLPDEIFAG